MSTAFKANDIRGIYPDEVNEELAREVAKTLSENFFGKGTVVVGRDMRIGSEEMYNETIATLKEQKRKVIEVGLMTTPMLVFLVNDLNAAGGIMITASHNPKEYNGIKMLKGGGTSISGEDVKKVMNP